MKRRIKKDIVLILLGVAIVAIPFLLRMKEQERSNRYMKAFEEEQNRNWREKVRSPILVVVSACFRCFGSRRIFLRSQRGRADAGNMMWHCINGRMERMCFIVL